MNITVLFLKEATSKPSSMKSREISAQIAKFKPR